MTFYKITKNDLTSAIMREDRNHGLEVQYKIGEFVQPHESLLKLGYGLCVFGSLDEALEYYRILTVDDDLRVFKCEVQELVNPQPNRFPISSGPIVCFDDVINDKISQYGHKISWFKGTILVGAVKLLEEVNV